MIGAVRVFLTLYLIALHAQHAPSLLLPSLAAIAAWPPIRQYLHSNFVPDDPRELKTSECFFNEWKDVLMSRDCDCYIVSEDVLSLHLQCHKHLHEHTIRRLPIHEVRPAIASAHPTCCPKGKTYHCSISDLKQSRRSYSPILSEDFIKHSSDVYPVCDTPKK